jgi:hypothetical protein
MANVISLADRQIVELAKEIDALVIDSLRLMYERQGAEACALRARRLIFDIATAVAPNSTQVATTCACSCATSPATSRR